MNRRRLIIAAAAAIIAAAIVCLYFWQRRDSTQPVAGPVAKVCVVAGGSSSLSQNLTLSYTTETVTDYLEMKLETGRRFCGHLQLPGLKPQLFNIRADKPLEQLTVQEAPVQERPDVNGLYTFVVGDVTVISSPVWHCFEDTRDKEITTCAPSRKDCDYLRRTQEVESLTASPGKVSQLLTCKPAKSEPWCFRVQDKDPTQKPLISCSTTQSSCEKIWMNCAATPLSHCVAYHDMKHDD